ncbi:nicotinate-nucleotide--dimethylbenzimidazole phosphoribosyltransferase [Teredinibacter sp. KSP-S5-2]|uniref:nicotinate-nucleotide--dimethylbenzimidazole phosphoribosyltransferase n=1 Tax=Teredinibacter sp. KSP-S5-2 TaxID=3034506 RepID=UPI0029346213|nr:nicotinate-nucleotide--dimethylbenzimidazole phosphoribosyltransferase [Teredinibacter sp. KSP-S5-2]WNO08371.1 nicotinate-nucleotide--dimethylbenzimidazole phosphoribosyltransferase [Teredinibacter sp. KSP-S5-2]
MLSHSLDWLKQPVQPLNTQAKEAAIARQNILTKPRGSLGLLEEVATQFAAWQGQECPQLDRIIVRVFAGDHGVCQQGVSAFPQIVTVQMIENFVQGGAAISVLSRDAKADFAVVNMGVANPLLNDAGVINTPVGDGTHDFSEQPAMSQEQCAQAINLGRESLGSLEGITLYVAGEMGIGNTTSASAIYAALLGLSAEEVSGPGTGVDLQGIQRKIKAIKTALDLHREQLTEPLDILRCVGGFEIAAMVGSYIACAQQGVPSVVDGFISTAAALLAVKINPGVSDWLLFSHQSAEPAHVKALEYMQAKALLNLGMRLGEGSGAATAIPLLRTALLLHNQMATFDQAGVNSP